MTKFAALIRDAKFAGLTLATLVFKVFQSDLFSKPESRNSFFFPEKKKRLEMPLTRSGLRLAKDNNDVEFVAEYESYAFVDLTKLERRKVSILLSASLRF